MYRYLPSFLTYLTAYTFDINTPRFRLYKKTLQFLYTIKLDFFRFCNQTTI